MMYRQLLQKQPVDSNNFVTSKVKANKTKRSKRTNEVTILAKTVFKVWIINRFLVAKIVQLKMISHNCEANGSYG